MSKRTTRRYETEQGKQVTPSQLARLGKETQISVMRRWFYKNYSDPNVLPYDSSEGGYQWIWGGPYDAEEELDSEFTGVAKDAAIEQLASELNRENCEWSANPDKFPPDEDDLWYLQDLPLAPHEHLEIGLDEIMDASKISSLGPREQFIHRLLFANAITVMETYLSDKFRRTIKGNSVLIQKFLETFSGFQNMQIPMKSVIVTAQNVEKIVSKELDKVVWHRLEKVGSMYEKTFAVSFPTDLAEIKKAITQRHDIIHRNGKSANGTMGAWDAKSIVKLVKAVRKFAAHIESKLPEPIPNVDTTPEEACLSAESIPF